MKHAERFALWTVIIIVAVIVSIPVATQLQRFGVPINT